MLLVYSGNVPELDALLAETLLNRCDVLTIIPATPKEYRLAAYLADDYRELGIPAQSLSQKQYLDSSQLNAAISTSNAVYLMGGNTYEFLDYAKNVYLFPILAKLEANGGIIAAESAGSIILSDTIATAGLPSSDVDENTLNMTNFEAMGRLGFHISPHFNPEKTDLGIDLDELQSLANVSGQDVLLLEDGEGFVMEGDVIKHFIGKKKFLNAETSTPANNALISRIQKANSL